MKIDRSKEQPEPEVVNSEELQRQNEALNKLLNNPPEYEQRQTQNRQDQMAELRRQQAEMRRINKEAGEERAKQQENLDLEQKKQEMLRYIERMNQQQQSQNPEIDEEDW